MVNPESGKVDVLNVWIGEDIGRAINPKACEGQAEGGAVQGMSYALTEYLLLKDGGILNPGFTDYRIPIFTNTPKIHTILIETMEPAGPYGAKSIGEAVLNPVAPAIANAVYDAVGLRIKDLPLSAENVLMAIKDLTKDGERSWITKT